MIVFSHANSFSAATYGQLFDGWRAAGHEVAAVAHFGHDARFPVDRRWRGMTQQLTALIDSLPQPRVWLVGHSMGGYLSLLAAGQRPERVRGIVLLDSPLVYGWKSGLIGAVKATGQMWRMSPAAAAERRRDHWPNLAEAHRHFAAKPMFARWHPDVLNDYIRFGTEQDPADGAGAGRRLSFRPAIEAEIYSTVPHRLVEYLRLHPPGGPVAFIGGRRSREVRQVGLAATQRLTQGRISWLEGSHLFPFERPEETMREVLDWMQRLDALVMERE
ncbi:MAG: alpha/beta hydrolase [Sulfuritalea sp.]|jgi:pimeloyl-ACP methyl ester carboxylesterase|nr:alpha/beta hydrolase [Sulfuritalea sp.]